MYLVLTNLFVKLPRTGDNEGTNFDEKKKGKTWLKLRLSWIICYLIITQILILLRMLTQSFYQLNSKIA